MEADVSNQPVVYICASCGFESQTRADGTVACGVNPTHKVLYKKRSSRPLVYKAI